MPDDPSEAIARVANAALGKLSEVDRSRTLDAVLNKAADVGAEKALELVGSSLSESEKDIVRSLSKDELVALRTIKGKIGGVNPAAHNFII